MADGNLDTYCGTGTDYAAGTTTCTFTFNTTTAPADGNYFVDINITTEVTGGGVDQNSVTDSSDNNFVIDNTVPTVTFTVPTAASTSASQTVTFDLNDNSSAIVLGSTIVLVNGLTSTVLVTVIDCIPYSVAHN